MTKISSNNYQTYQPKQQPKQHKVLKTTAKLAFVASVAAGGYYLGKHPDTITNIRKKFFNKQKLNSTLSSIKTFLLGIGIGKAAVKVFDDKPVENRVETKPLDEKNNEDIKQKDTVEAESDSVKPENNQAEEELPASAEASEESSAKLFNTEENQTEQNEQPEQDQDLDKLVLEIKNKLKTPSERETFYNSLGTHFFDDAVSDIDAQITKETLRAALEKDKLEHATERIIPTENGYKKTYHVKSDDEFDSLRGDITVEDEYKDGELVSRRSMDVFNTTIEYVDFKNKQVIVPSETHKRETMYDFKKGQISDYVINLANGERICVVTINPKTKGLKMTINGLTKGIWKEIGDVRQFAQEASEKYAQLDEKYFTQG